MYVVGAVLSVYLRGTCYSVLFSDKQNDHFQCQIEEYDLGISVLCDVSFAFLQFFRNVYNVALVNKSGKVS